MARRRVPVAAKRAPATAGASLEQRPAQPHDQRALHPTFLAIVLAGAGLLVLPPAGGWKRQLA